MAPCGPPDQHNWDQLDSHAAAWPAIARGEIAMPFPLRRSHRGRKIHRTPYLGGAKLQECDTHPEWCGSNCRDAAFSTGRKDSTSRLERKRIQTIDVQIDTGEEFIDVVVIDAIGKDSHISRWIDIKTHFFENIRLQASKRRHHRASLSVEIDYVERVKIGNRKRTNSESCQREQVTTANAAQPGVATLLPLSASCS